MLYTVNRLHGAVGPSITRLRGARMLMMAGEIRGRDCYLVGLRDSGFCTSGRHTLIVEVTITDTPLLLLASSIHQYQTQHNRHVSPVSRQVIPIPDADPADTT